MALWDCAEFMSWLVYQVGGVLYGCVDDKGDPATVEAYTGAWQTDLKKLGKRVPKEQARPRSEPFFFVIRRRREQWGTSS